MPFFTEDFLVLLSDWGGKYTDWRCPARLNGKTKHVPLERVWLFVSIGVLARK